MFVLHLQYATIKAGLKQVCLSHTNNFWAKEVTVSPLSLFSVFLLQIQLIISASLELIAMTTTFFLYFLSASIAPYGLSAPFFCHIIWDRLAPYSICCLILNEPRSSQAPNGVLGQDIVLLLHICCLSVEAHLHKHTHQMQLHTCNAPGWLLTAVGPSLGCLKSFHLNQSFP